MNCMNCGAQAGHENVCPVCGCDLSVQKKSIQLSDIYYNQGLDKAQIRDLSGAIDLLKRSLKYNKRNLTARNLLGLIYFETGEAVAALSEWVISKNLKPEDNIASEFIEKVQAEPERLDTIHTTIKRYNSALAACRDGNEDVAEIMLKKVISANPRLLKAFHLLALIYIKNKEWSKARKVLKRASMIDRTNSTTLRFMKEINAQTKEIPDETSEAVITGFSEEKKSVFTQIYEKITGKTRDKNRIPENFWDDDDEIENMPVNQQTAAFRELPAFAAILYVLLGLGLGILVVWFLVVPTVRAQVNRSANDKIAQYSSEMAEQTRNIESLEGQVEEGKNQLSDVNAQFGTANERTAEVEKVLEAYYDFKAGRLDQSKNLLDSVNTDYLSDFGKYVQFDLSMTVNAALFNQLAAEGKQAFERADYKTAITKLLKAQKLNDTDYDVLSYLAHSYRMNHDAEKAKSAFQEILIKFPADATAVAAAQHYLDLLEQGLFGDETPAQQAAVQQAAAEAAAQAEAEAAAQAEAEAEAEAAAQEEAEAAAQAEAEAAAQAEAEAAAAAEAEQE